MKCVRICFNITRVVSHVARSDTPNITCDVSGLARRSDTVCGMFFGLKDHTRAVPVVISNDLRAAPASRLAWNVYVTLADGAYCMHIHIFNKVAARKTYECQKYEKNHHRFKRMRTRT